MNDKKREDLRKRILERNKLYKLNYSRLLRVIKDPIRTMAYYVLQAVGYIHPYKVSYKTLWGSRMSFYLPEGGMIYYYGFWEANLVNFFTRFIKEGDIVFDIGAHVGYYSILASDLTGPSGQVHSFEPTPRTFATLLDNAKTKKNITTYNKAVLNEETEITFFDYGPKYSAFNGCNKRTNENIPFKDKAQKISVKTMSLDTLCKEKNIQPDLIKIDAEGSEYLILEAMSYILETIHPVVTIEVSDQEEWQHNMKRSFEILASYNYQAYEALDDGHIQLCDVGVERPYDNLIFIHQKTLEKRSLPIAS